MDFVTTAQNLGVAVACLFALGLGLWQAMKWIGTHIVKPVADRHCKFLDELSTATASQSQALQTMAIQQGRNLEGLERIMEQLGQVMARQEDLLERLTSIKESPRA